MAWQTGPLDETGAILDRCVGTWNVREEKKSEMNKQEKSLGLKKQWYKRSRKGDYSGLDTWKGLRRKDYQMQLYMDM